MAKLVAKLSTAPTPLIVGYGYFVLTLREYSLRVIYNHLVEMKTEKNYAMAGFDLENYRKLAE
jgi:hypothetical protein